MSAFCLTNWAFNAREHGFCAVCNTLMTGLHLSSSLKLVQVSAPRALLGTPTASLTTCGAQKALAVRAVVDAVQELLHDLAGAAPGVLGPLERPRHR